MDEAALTPEILAEELRKRGLAILAVDWYRGHSDVLEVYLHGNAGQWVNREALTTVAAVPGVLAVSESVPTSTILLVRVESEPSEGERQTPAEELDR
ncbi:MAG TPA: hypothetical protein VLL08_27420 [Kineosporiaceae bacterium]|nr:hypothetical protein [Kineosporiaceae bacterium]